MKTINDMQKLQQTNISKTSKTILDLHNDTLRVIASYLNTKDAIRFGISMKKFYQAVFSKGFVLNVLENEALSQALKMSVSNTDSQVNVETESSIMSETQLLWNKLVINTLSKNKPEDNLNLIKFSMETIDTHEQKSKSAQRLLCFINNCDVRSPGYSVFKFIGFIFGLLACVAFLGSMVNAFSAPQNYGIAMMLMAYSLILMCAVAAIWYPGCHASCLAGTHQSWKDKFNGKVSELANKLGIFNKDDSTSSGNAKFESADVENALPVVNKLAPNLDENADEKTRLLIN